MVASRTWRALDNPPVFHATRYALVGGQGIPAPVRRVLPVERVVRFDVGFYTEIPVRCPSGPETPGAGAS